MEIKDILDKNLIQTELNATTKDDALKQIIASLKEHNYISDEEEFTKAIYEREAEGKTGIGSYIAIPHGKSEAVNKIGVSVAISDTEIPWESIDEKGAKVIVLFAVGADNEGANQHLKLLSLFARKLGRDEVVNALIDAKTSDEVIEIFTKE